MRIAFIAAVMSLLMLTTASWTKCSAKNVTASNIYVTKEYMLDPFENIQASGNLAIEFTQDGGNSVKLYTSDNIMDLVEIKVVDGTLTAGIKKGYNILGEKHITLFVSAPSVNAITLNGAVNLSFKGQVNQPGLSITASGAARIQCDGIRLQEARIIANGAANVNLRHLDCERISLNGNGACDIKISDTRLSAGDFELSGAGSMSLSGHCQKAIFNLSGVGSINAKDMTADDVMANCSGMGSIYCHAENAIMATASGLSKIHYTGNPGTVSVSKGVSHQ